MSYLHSLATFFTQMYIFVTFLHQFVTLLPKFTFLWLFSLAYDFLSSKVTFLCFFVHYIVTFYHLVALHVDGDESTFSMTWFNIWQYKMSVISWTQYSNICNNYTENTWKNTDTKLICKIAINDVNKRI